MKMILVLLMLSTSAFAHIKFGIYKGTTETLESCQIRIMQKTYFLNIKHPLNERILVEMGTRNFFELVHPVVVNKDLEKVSVSHDFLNGQNGDSEFSRSISLKMSHEAGNDGPKSFEYLVYNYKTKDFTSLNCLNLQYQD